MYIYGYAYAIVSRAECVHVCPSAFLFFPFFFFFALLVKVKFSIAYTVQAIALLLYAEGVIIHVFFS